MLIPKREKATPAQVKKHTKFVRSLGLCVAAQFRDEPCYGVVDSCHIRKGFFCKQRKPIKREIPMCRTHHTIQHHIGERDFFGGYMDKLISLAEYLWDISGDREKAKQACSCIKER